MEALATPVQQEATRRRRDPMTALSAQKARFVSRPLFPRRCVVLEKYALKARRQPSHVPQEAIVLIPQHSSHVA